MDTANLIEEAERWAKNVSESPGNGTAGEDLYGAKLLCDLAAALKASEEQNGAIRRGLDWERAEREKVAEFARKIGRERDDLAAANLAANKRIVELEHERDEARSKLSRLTTPRPIAEAPKDERSRILARGRDGQWREMRLVRGEWRWFGAGNEHIESPTEYLPLPVLP